MKLKLEKTISDMQINLDIYRGEYTEEEIGKAFGRSLRALRKHGKLSLDTLSKEVDIPNPTINRYENGINIPTITQALKLADFFGVTIEEMIVCGICEESEEKIIAMVK